MDPINYLNSLIFVDSRFPSGSFRFSNGVEAAIKIKLVKDTQTLERFIEAQVANSELTKCEFCFVAAQLTAHDLVSQLPILNDLLKTRFTSRAERETMELKARSLTRMVGLLAEKHLGYLNGLFHPIVFGSLFASVTETTENVAAAYLHDAIQNLSSPAVKLLGIDPYLAASISIDIASRFSSALKIIEAKSDIVYSLRNPDDWALSKKSWPISDILFELSKVDKESLFVN